MASYQSYNSQGSYHWDQQQQWAKARREERVRNRAAALSVRKVIVRFRHATRSTYEELHKELHASEQENRAMMGEEAAKVREEILRAVKQVQTRFASEPPEGKAAPRQQRQDGASNNDQELSEAEALAQAASEEVELAEAKVAEVAGVAEPIIEASAVGAEEGAAPALPPKQALAVADATEEAMGSAVTCIKEAAAKVVEKAREMGLSAEAVQIKNSADFKALHERLAACKQVIEKLRAKVAAAREDANARLAESGGAEAEANGDTFQKYDKDGDGLLSIDDMVELAKNEHDFEMTEVHLGWILEDLGEGATGVTAEHFPWLESTIQELQWSYCLARMAFEEVQAAEALVVAAEQAAAPLLQEPNAAEAVILERIKATEEAVASAIPAIKGAAGTVVEKAREMGQSALVERVKNSEEYVDLHSRLTVCKTTIEQIRGIVTSTQEKCKGGGAAKSGGGAAKNAKSGGAAANKNAKSGTPAAAAPPVEPLSKEAELAALVALHARIAAAVDTFRSEKGVKSQADLLGMSGIGSGTLDMDKFIAFVELIGGAAAVDAEAGAADVCSFFAYLSAGEESLSKEKLVTMFAPPRLRTIKDTVMTENRDLGLGMKTACRLQKGDLVVPTGPVATTAGSHRLFCRAINSGSQGWATMVSPNGTQLLELVTA